MLNFRAILIGISVNLVGSVIAANIIITIYIAVKLDAGVDRFELVESIRDLETLPTLLWGLIAAGAFFDCLSGYITARLARFLEFWHVLAMVGMLWVISFALDGSSMLSTKMKILSIFISTVAAFTGAYLGKSKNLSSPNSV